MQSYIGGIIINQIQTKAPYQGAIKTTIEKNTKGQKKKHKLVLIELDEVSCRLMD